ncbi:phosphotransferase enzyme family protein [Mucilaginibacter segetis]|uniref:Phosphotransferase n=1 Tax=Mucilaginibacter segetis TaxID=2793071 RepID=A0A934PPH3_9SPHI|nr:phosphotransferase [Mucilaginibacter segetis]MBK0377699.1 phosphotransferase [Mucilaginibacter segetis]
MKPFPVVTSTLSPRHLADYVQDTYHLSAGTTCKLLKAGINHSYLINNGESKYVFRVYSLNWRTRAEIEEELRLLNLLQEKGISVSYPLKDDKGKYIQELPAPEGVRFGVLFSYANGDKLLNFPAELHYTVGETMARIHQLTQNMDLERITYAPDVLLIAPFEHLDKFLPAESEEMTWMLSIQNYLLEELEKADKSKLRKGAVHMDIWFDNLNITEDGRITIFDFDFCGNGWLCNDIAYYILQLHSTEKDETERMQKLDSFLKGYESITPINAEEKRMLAMLGVSIYFFYLGVQCQRFDNWSNVFMNETHLKRFINILIKPYFEKNVIG